MTTTNGVNENEILQAAIDKWGYDAQRLIWIEEMAELTQALAKATRNLNFAAEEAISEEIADVDICLSQMKLKYPDWKLWRDVKLKRLVERLESTEDKGNWDTVPGRAFRSVGGPGE